MNGSTFSITCPSCNVSKEFTYEQLPPNAVWVTCHKCGHRFTFTPHLEVVPDSTLGTIGLIGQLSASIENSPRRNARCCLIEWSEQGIIAPNSNHYAATVAGVLPDLADWKNIADRFCLLLGTAFVTSGIIFFITYKWQALNRFAKIGLVELLIVSLMLLIWRLGLERSVGKAILFTTALLIGALLVLIGQIYQTGADTFELFIAWGVAILPWVIIGRFALLWIFWLTLTNLAMIYYFKSAGILFGQTFSLDKLLWLLFFLNTLALIIWEFMISAGVDWLQEWWATRLLAAASGICSSMLAINSISELQQTTVAGILCWVVWLGAIYAVYRHQIRDIYVLAGGLLSIIVVTAFFLSKHLQDQGPLTLLYIGIATISLLAIGVYGLKIVTRDEETE